MGEYVGIDIFIKWVWKNRAKKNKKLRGNQINK